MRHPATGDDDERLGPLAGTEDDHDQDEQTEDLELPWDAVPPAHLADPLAPDPVEAFRWQLGRPRRLVVKTLGWLLVAASLGGVATLARIPRARVAMGSWATLGIVSAPR